jgi:DNA-binding transcriptional LysR family regulator
MTDLSLLRSFLQVADSGTITTAARRLFLTQPALSRRLQLLEADFGAELLQRSRQGVQLTEEGRLVQRFGSDLVERWDRMKDSVAAISSMDTGTVRLGGGATAVSFLLPAAIAEFQRSHPGILFQVKEAGSRDVERDVLEERIELGIVTLPVESDAVEILPLRRDRIVLVASKDHPLAKKSRIHVKSLQDQDLVGFESPSAIRSLIDGALHEAEVRVHVVMELRSIPAILRMVGATDCLAFVSQLGVGGDTSGVRVLPVTGLKIERQMAILRKRDRPLSPAAAQFVKLLRAGREGR